MKNITRVLSRRLSPVTIGALTLFGSLLLPSVAAAESETDMREPAEVYRQVCSHCHETDVANKVAPITMAFPEVAHEARGNYIRMTVRNGRAAMPSFREAKISDPELEALIQALMGGDLAPAADSEE
ncbi:cytochrome c [Halomonas sp. KAO]|uniref:c-type cytochrome n=1 Tax=Halomonas sp. KAO TaxID=2783858 RepID=UPI00189D255E|nr:cytochrome c [Halomonas sp. KAO]MBF7054887.1 cytochrome c [Halomonas sp. KAO]